MILVGESVVKEAPEYFYREIDRVKVKGKDKNVTIYTPLGLISEVSTQDKEESKAWELALHAYYEGHWDDAIAQLKSLVAQYGDKKLYEVYLERCATYKASPPAKDWGGVYTFTEK